MFINKVLRTGINYFGKRPISKQNHPNKLSIGEKFVIGYITSGIVTGSISGITYGYQAVEYSEHMSKSAFSKFTTALPNFFFAFTIHLGFWPIAFPCFLHDCYYKILDSKII